MSTVIKVRAACDVDLADKSMISKQTTIINNQTINCLYKITDIKILNKSNFVYCQFALPCPSSPKINSLHARPTIFLFTQKKERTSKTWRKKLNDEIKTEEKCHFFFLCCLDQNKTFFEVFSPAGCLLKRPQFFNFPDSIILDNRIFHVAVYSQLWKEGWSPSFDPGGTRLISSLSPSAPGRVCTCACVCACEWQRWWSCQSAAILCPMTSSHGALCHGSNKLAAILIALFLAPHEPWRWRASLTCDCQRETWVQRGRQGYLGRR